MESTLHSKIKVKTSNERENLKIESYSWTKASYETNNPGFLSMEI